MAMFSCVSREKEHKEKKFWWNKSYINFTKILYIQKDEFDINVQQIDFKSSSSRHTDSTNLSVSRHPSQISI